MMPACKFLCLIELVDADARANPPSLDGHSWSIRPLHWYAARLGVSGKLIGKWLNQPEFAIAKRMKGGSRTLHLRVRTPCLESDPRESIALLRNMYTEAMLDQYDRREKFLRKCIMKFGGHVALESFYANDRGTSDVLEARRNVLKSLEDKLKRIEEEHVEACCLLANTEDVNSLLGKLANACGVDAPWVLRAILDDWSGFKAHAEPGAAQKYTGVLTGDSRGIPILSEISSAPHIALEFAMRRLWEVEEQLLNAGLPHSGATRRGARLHVALQLELRDYQAPWSLLSTSVCGWGIRGEQR